MGLFPRTIGKGFPGARTGVPWGPHRRPRPPAKGDGGGKTGGRDHAGLRIFMRDHNILCRLPCFLPRGEGRNLLLGPGPCKFSYPDFGESSFYEVG